MKTELYYFTGTGNSLYIARELAKRLAVDGESVTVISIASLDLSSPMVSEADRIGIIFPVYFVDIPDPVARFIRALEVPRSTRIFIADNFGEYDWGVLRRVRKLLGEKGLKLFASFRFYMPDNSITFPSGPEKTEAFLRDCLPLMDEVAGHVLRDAPHFDDGSMAFAPIIAPMMRSICYGILGFRDMRLNAARCTGCGVCSQVCPEKIIKMNDGKPEWTDRKRCAACFACIHACPAKAVTYRGQKNVDGYQYRNPHVCLEDLKSR